MTLTIQGVRFPDSRLGREITDLVRDTVSPLLFYHSSGVHHFGALAGSARDQDCLPQCPVDTPPGTRCKNSMKGRPA
jgi:hypothetical protein